MSVLSIAAPLAINVNLSAKALCEAAMMNSDQLSSR
jgi:hypothetical protein